MLNGGKFVECLQAAYEVGSQAAVARKLGITQGRVSQLSRKNKKLNEKQVAKVLAGSRRGFARDFVKTVVEFFPVRKTPSKQKKKWEFLGRDKAGENQLRTLLREKKGIYFFYDSQGSVIYVGKATKQSLLSEMKDAFNRAMSEHAIWRVRHPKRLFEGVKVEKGRSIRRHYVGLYETAAYFSVYEADEPMVIRKLETLFIRAIPNDLTNVRIEGQTDRKVG